METKSLRRALDANFDKILSSLPKSFSSKQFIDTFQRYEPGRYADALKDAGSFRLLHAWIARHYLNEQAKSGKIKKGNRDLVTSRMGKTTKNQLWEKK